MGDSPPKRKLAKFFLYNIKGHSIVEIVDIHALYLNGSYLYAQHLT